MTSDAYDAWKQRQEHRVETVSAPYGRAGDFRTSPGSGRPTATAWC